MKTIFWRTNKNATETFVESRQAIKSERAKIWAHAHNQTIANELGALMSIQATRKKRSTKWWYIFISNVYSNCIK